MSDVGIRIANVRLENIVISREYITGTVPDVGSVAGTVAVTQDGEDLYLFEYLAVVSGTRLSAPRYVEVFDENLGPSRIDLSTGRHERSMSPMRVF